MQRECNRCTRLTRARLRGLARAQPLHTRRRMKSLLALSVLAGCGLVKIQTHGGSSTTSNDPRAEPTIAGDIGARITAAFKAFDATKCGDECGGVMRKQAGIPERDHVNPKTVIQNPAPEWITGWNQLPSSPDDVMAEVTTFDAMTLAASRAAWQKECDGRYAKLDVELRAFDAQIAVKLAAAQQISNAYVRVNAIVDLSHEVDAARPRDNRSYEDELWVAVGALDTVKHAYEATLAAMVQPYVANYLELELTGDLGSLRPRGSVADEHALFCAEAYADHVTSLPPPSIQELREGLKYVREPVPPETVARVKALESTREHHIWGQKEKLKGQLPEGVAIHEALVVKRDGNKLTLETIAEENTDVNCKRGRLLGFYKDGSLWYDEHCTHIQHITVEDTEVEFAELPAPELVDPKVGDRVIAIARERSRTKKNGAAGKRFGANGGWMVNVALSDALFVGIQRDNQLIYPFKR
jgi:hypothetical protein